MKERPVPGQDIVLVPTPGLDAPLGTPTGVGLGVAYNGVLVGALGGEVDGDGRAPLARVGVPGLTAPGS